MEDVRKVTLAQDNGSRQLGPDGGRKKNRSSQGGKKNVELDSGIG